MVMTIILHARIDGWESVTSGSRHSSQAHGRMAHCRILPIDKQAFKGDFFNIPESGVKDLDMSILSRSQRKSAPCLVADVGSPNERNFKANKHEVSLWSQYGVLMVIGIISMDTLLTTTVEDRWENVGIED